MILKLCINDQKKTYSTSVENWQNVKPSGGARQTGEQVRCGLCLPNTQSLLSKYVLRRASIYTGNLYFFQLAFAEYTLLSLSHVCLDYLPLGTSLRACLSISSVSSVQLFGRVRPSAIPWNAAPQGFPVLHYLLEFPQTHVHWVGDAIQPSHPLSLPSPPALNLSQHQGLFQWVCFWHQLAKVLDLQLQHQPCECSGLISFRIDWFDLLAV